MAILENRIKAVRREKGWSQQRLAQAVGVHWITISKLERGVQKLTFEWIERLATALDVPNHKLLEGERVVASTVITGIINQDEGYVTEYPEDYGDVRYVFSSLFDSHTDDFVEVKGNVLWPFFHSGDIICITHTHRASEDFYGRFVWFLVQGEKYARVGVLSPGNGEGLYTLQVGNKPPNRDIRGTVKGYISLAAFNLPQGAQEKTALQNAESRISLETAHAEAAKKRKKNSA